MILAEEPDKDLKQCKFICKFPIIDRTKYNENILKLRNLLRMKGINSYYVKIPTENEVMQHPLFYYSFSDAFLWTKYKEKKTREILPLITSKSYEESKGWMKRKKWIEKAGSGKRKIYLVGPCIVNGDEVFTEDELAVLLARAVEREGLDYEVIKICMSWFQFDTPTEKILEYDIYKNDIVIFLDEAIEGYDLDLTEIYKNYKGNEWLYVDVPIHTTKRGNEQIASALLNEIVLPGYKKSYVQDDNIVLQHGKKQLTCREKEELDSYLNKIDHLITVYPVGKDIAAIVMTGNPFTYGHQYLVEWGSRNSDFLYIFVVEENAFLFSFEERIALIREGTKHLDNVQVLPGGRFLASKTTFSNYYEREKTDENEVDASKDIFFFSEYIAPFLHIKKRFVGEEPIDKVTAQYNRQLSERLPKYGIELREISRKKFEKQIISASLVRQCIALREYDRIQLLVPESTHRYIKDHIEELKGRLEEKENPQLSDFWEKYLQSLKVFIEEHEYVVIYGAGANAKKIVELLGKECIKKVIFCDCRAEKEQFYFCEKRVISPKELYSMNKNIHVLISTEIYRRDIFLELSNNGIQNERISCAVNMTELFAK